jgi:hypothetical protein
MKAVNLAITVVSTAFLLTFTGTSRSAEPTAATLKREELMPLVFPGWTMPGAPDSNRTSHSPRTPLSSLGDVVPAIEHDLGEESESIEPHPLHVIRLDSDHAVLITQSDLYDADNEWICGHYAGCAVVIGAYFFGSTVDGWKLTKRVDDIAVDYNFADAGIHKWPGHGFLLSINSKTSAQGGSRKDVGFVLLQPDRAILAHERSIGIAGDNDGGQTAYEIHDPETQQLSMEDSGCAEFMQSSFNSPKGATFDASSVDVCTQTRGTWHIEQDTIRLTYRILRRGIGPRGELQGINETTVIVDLGIRDGELKIIAGIPPEISTT